MARIGRTAKICGLGLACALLHFAIFSVSYVQSHVTPSAGGAAGWRLLADILGLPLIPLASLSVSVDVFPFAAYANSLLWGVSCAALALWVKRRRRS